MKKNESRPIRTVIAAVDLTDMDNQIIRFTALMCKLLPIEKVFVVHVAQSLELPKEVLDKYPDLLAPLDESIERDLWNKVNGYFDGIPAQTEVIIKEGNAISEITSFCKIKSADLIVMGRKKQLKGSGIVSSHIARRSPCSLLLVPEGAPEQINRIVAALDFSGHSAMATQHALEIAAHAKAELHLAHAFSVPLGYYKTGKSYQEFAEIMEDHARSDLKRFMHAYELSNDLNYHFLLAERGQYVEPLNQFCHDSKADLIIIGSKGRTNASAFLIGSMAEKLAFKDDDIPLLIIKGPQENMKLMETLLRI